MRMLKQLFIIVFCLKLIIFEMFISDFKKRKKMKIVRKVIFKNAQGIIVKMKFRRNKSVKM